MLFALLGANASCRESTSEGTSPSDSARLQQIEAEYEEYRAKEFPDVSEVSADQLQKWLPRLRAGELLLVDQRTAAEQAVSRIPHALTVAEYERLGAEERKKKPVITYCTIGLRSGKYARQLKAKGIHVMNLRGSILSWTHVGGELVDSQQRPTRRVHVYGKRWNWVASGYEAVW